MFLIAPFFFEGGGVAASGNYNLDPTAAIPP
jgi:hypothetical protein